MFLLRSEAVGHLGFQGEGRVGSGFSVQGLGVRVWGSGFRGHGLWCMVTGEGFGGSVLSVQCSVCRVRDGCRVYGVGCAV